MPSEVKKYECAYLLLPSLNENEILPYTAKITDLIQEAGGTIRKSETPKRRQLAYPIKKERSAYFGWTTFTLAPEFLKGVEKKLKEIKEVLRMLLMEEEIETRIPYIRPFFAREPAARSVKPAVPRAEEKVDEKLDLEALDKKLEEILGK